MRGMKSDNKSQREYYQRKAISYGIEDAAEKPPSEMLPAFIRNWAKKPMGCQIPWDSHIEQWAFGRKNVATVSYEELRNDCQSAMTRLLEQHTSKAVDQDRLKNIVANHSFEALSGRKAGTEDPDAFIRKGIVGDWKNHFGTEAAQVFDHHFGETLVKLGYETDRGWPTRLARVPVAQST